MTTVKKPVEPTTVAIYTQLITRALEVAGVDPDLVFSAARVTSVHSNDPMQRISDDDINALFAAAVAATGDEYFGLKVASLVMPGILHALGYALLASDTLEEFCYRLTRYYTLVAKNVETKVSDDGTELKLTALSTNPNLCFESHDVWAGLVLRLMRSAYQKQLNPVRVALFRPLPAGGEQPFVDFFKCPVSFGQDITCLYFNLETMREPLLGASPELAQQNDQVVIGYLEKLDKDDIVNRVRGHIVNGLSAGAFSRSQIAASVNMSASTLQVKLARRNLSFQQLLDETRHELALGYIAQSRLSVTEIAFMLGFSDLSNFIRAFKRWTGRSPTEYRSDS